MAFENIKNVEKTNLWNKFRIPLRITMAYNIAKKKKKEMPVEKINEAKIYEKF
jgi:hypothetical protein